MNTAALPLSDLRLLHAWELGAGFGHIGTFAPIARRVLAGGGQVAVAAREVQAAAQLLGGSGALALQAPFLSETPLPGVPLTYPDILRRFGFGAGQRKALAAYVTAWLDLFRLFRPNAITADHSPAVLLAARIAGIPVMLLSSGFCVPPRSAPLPALRPWQPVEEQVLWQIEAEVTASCNAVLSAHGRPPLNAFFELFDVAEPTLLGFPELDHYERNGRYTYWGNIGSAGGGEPAIWPATPGAKIFAYLRLNMGHCPAMLNALLELGQPTLLYCPDLPADAAARLQQAPHIRCASGPVDLAAAVQQADLAITYASYSATTAFLQGGVPVLVTPGHLEQFLFARRIADNGFGLVISPDDKTPDVAGALVRALRDPALRASVRAFAARYAGFAQDDVVGRIVAQIRRMAG